MGVLNVYFRAKKELFKKLMYFFHFYFNFLHVFRKNDTHSS